MHPAARTPPAIGPPNALPDVSDGPAQDAQHSPSASTLSNSDGRGGWQLVPDAQQMRTAINGASDCFETAGGTLRAARCAPNPRVLIDGSAQKLLDLC